MGGGGVWGGARRGGGGGCGGWARRGACGFPEPVGWAIDKASGFVSDEASSGFELLIGGLTAWVVDALVWIVGGVFEFFSTSTDPNVVADWFAAGHGPYATTLTIGVSLLVLFVLAGITQGALAGDAGAMLRRIAFELPMSVIAMVGLVTFTQILIGVTDALSTRVLTNFESEIADFGSVVSSLASLGGARSSAFVVFVLGLVAVLAGLVLVAELVVRSALIYIVVALAPLVFAARVWPATQAASRKLVDLLVALIVSKLVIAVALAVAAAAVVGVGSGGEVTALPAPEVASLDPGGSVTQAVGILLAAVAAFGVSAFSPLLIARLLPVSEAAAIASGVKGGPVRAAHQAGMMANTAQMVSGLRYRQIAAERTGDDPACSSDPGPGPGDGPDSGPASRVASGPPVRPAPGSGDPSAGGRTAGPAAGAASPTAGSGGAGAGAGGAAAAGAGPAGAAAAAAAAGSSGGAASSAEPRSRGAGSSHPPSPRSERSERSERPDRRRGAGPARPGRDGDAGSER